MRIVWGLPDSPRALGWPLPGRRRSTSRISNDWDVGYHYHLDIDSGRVIISMYIIPNIYIYIHYIHTYIHRHITLHYIALHCIALHCMTLHYIPLHTYTLFYYNFKCVLQDKTTGTLHSWGKINKFWWR